MAKKKQKITIHRDEDMLEIDNALDDAIVHLEGVNTNVKELLLSIEAVDEEGAEEGDLPEEESPPSEAETPAPTLETPPEQS